MGPEKRRQRMLAYFVKQSSGAFISPAERDQAERDRLESELELEQYFERIERQADRLWDDTVAQGTDPDPNVIWRIAESLTRRGRSAPMTAPTALPKVVMPRTRTRARGAGRPRAQATRSSAKSGDSGSDSDSSSSGDRAQSIWALFVRDVLERITESDISLKGDGGWSL
jgi:hypothetical protein